MDFMPRDLCNIIEEYAATLQGVLVQTLTLETQIEGVCTTEDGLMILASGNVFKFDCKHDSKHSVMSQLLTIPSDRAWLLSNGRLVSSTADGDFYLDGQNKKVLPRAFNTGASIRCAVLLIPDTVIVGWTDGAVYVWNIVSGQNIKLLGHSEQVMSVAFTSDGRPLSGSWDATARVWDSSNGSCLHVLEGHTQPVYAVVGLFDGKIATGSADSTVRVWDMHGGCIHVLKGHQAGVQTLAELPDGALASGSWDHTVRVWDIKQGICLMMLKEHSVNMLGVAPNGTLASADSKGTVRIWK